MNYDSTWGLLLCLYTSVGSDYTYRVAPSSKSFLVVYGRPLCCPQCSAVDTMPGTFYELSLPRLLTFPLRRGCVNENLNASRPSGHPPVWRKNVKAFRWDHMLQRPNHFMVFKRASRW